LATVTQALEDLDNQGIDIQAVDSEIDKLALSLTTSMTNDSISKNLITSYPSGDTATIKNVLIMYQQSGNNINGTMTQKAITNYVEGVKSELNTTINSIPVGGGSTNLGSNNSGNIVVIDPDGNIIAGSTSEVTIIEALIKSGVYVAKDTVGLEIDYENKTFTRTQEATYYTQG